MAIFNNWFTVNGSEIRCAGHVFIEQNMEEAAFPKSRITPAQLQHHLEQEHSRECPAWQSTTLGEGQL